MRSKTVLITGASRGIGKALAHAFALDGWNMMINCYTHKDALWELRDMLCASYGIRCEAYIADVGSNKEVEEMFAHFYQLFPAVDAIINNAGISYIGLLSDMTPEEWDQVMKTNLYSAFYTAKYAIPQMIRQNQGKILNISSVWGISGASCEAGYSASKGGLHSLTKALAKELAPSNIQVNAIACGAIETSMNGFLSPDELCQLKEEIPAGRLGQPEEVAKLALALCQGHNYLTGQIIGLDGGWIS